jgi:GrpB-like predicted nucleotidyltransferase (UPF0157 family)
LLGRPSARSAAPAEPVVAAYRLSVSIAVLPYSDAWPVLFEQEAVRLRVVLKPWLVGGVHHIGSTAVPGLAAKPILDMLAGVDDLTQARDAVPVLANLDYQHADHRPHEALWFYKQNGDDYGTRTHQLHLTRKDSALWRERLMFRDALRAEPVLAGEYQALKRRLASQSEVLTDYTGGKREFVAAVLERAGLRLA